MKTLLLIAALAASSLTIASAKSYDVTLSRSTKAGSIELKPGQYRLKVDGTNAVFTDVNSAKSFTTPVKVQNTEQKFQDTRVQTSKDGDQDLLQEIDLGGSKTKLDF